jgi:Phage integrase family
MSRRPEHLGDIELSPPDGGLGRDQIPDVRPAALANFYLETTTLLGVHDPSPHSRVQRGLRLGAPEPHTHLLEHGELDLEVPGPCIIAHEPVKPPEAEVTVGDLGPHPHHGSQAQPLPPGRDRPGVAARPGQDVGAKAKVETGQLVVERAKSGKFRDVDLSESFVGRWRELEAIRAAEAAVAGRGPSPWCCPPLTNPYHRALNMSWFNAKVWARVLKKAELRRLRAYDTRRTYAALLLRQGKPMEYVQAPLGHAKIDTTIRFYAHFKPGVNRHYASDFAARIEAHEERDG